MTLHQLEPRFTEFLWKNNKELRWTCRPAITVNMMITDDRLLSHCNGSYGAHSSSIHIKLNEKKRRHKPSIALSILSAARNLVWGQRAVECRSLKYLCTWSMNDHAFLAGAQTNKKKFLLHLCQRESLTAQRNWQEAKTRGRGRQRRRINENSGKGYLIQARDKNEIKWALKRFGLMKTGHSHSLHDSSVRRGPHPRNLPGKI